MSYETISMAEKSKLIDRIYDHYAESKKYLAEWRKIAMEDYDFVAGDQYSLEDKSYLQAQRRPIITFNRIAPIIDFVAGTEINNRQEIKLIPREKEDGRVSEILNGAIKWVRDQCHAEDEETESFSDMLICGVGWLETHIDYTQDPQGNIFIERIDPFEIYWDPHAKKQNLSDARYVMRSRKVKACEIKSTWPEAKLFITEEEEEDYIEIIDYQWIDYDHYYRWWNKKYKKYEKIDHPTYKILIEKRPSLKSEMTPITQKTFKRAFVCNRHLLDFSTGPANPHGFTYQAITGKRDRNKNSWHGLVKAMKDPQKWANKWLSQVLHIINSNAKGGLLAERGAFIHPERAEENWTDPTSVTLLREGGIQKIMPKPMANYPSGLDQLMSFAITSIRDVSGVNQELLGLADRQQAGILEYQRKRAGLSLLSSLFNALRRYRKSQGRLLLHFIQNYISDGRVIRLYGKEGEEYLPLIRQNETATYDIIVDETPSSPNQKEHAFSILAQIMPFFLKSGVPVPTEVIDYLPLPEGLIKKWKDILQHKEAKAFSADFKTNTVRPE